MSALPAEVPPSGAVPAKICTAKTDTATADTARTDTAKADTGPLCPGAAFGPSAVPQQEVGTAGRGLHFPRRRGPLLRPGRASRPAARPGSAARRRPAAA